VSEKREENRTESGAAGESPQRKELLPFCLPTIGQAEKQEVLSVLDSGWLTAGAVTTRFEDQLMRYLGADHVIAVSSCTAALHLSLLALGVGPGDEVAVPSFTFCSTVNVIIHCGAKPLFIDISPQSYTLDPEDLEQKLTERTKAVMPVHYAGYPCDMKAILSIARKRGSFVIEDAAHALGARYFDSMIGAIGDATCFSFYPTKTITTGEGGALSTNDGDLAQRARLLSLHGMTRDAWERYTSSKTWQYKVEVPGYKYNMTDIEAALGTRQLDRIEEFLGARERLWDAYVRELAPVAEVTTPSLPRQGRHARHLFPVLLGDCANLTRDELLHRLRTENIGTSVHFYPVHMQPYYRDCCPGVSLPVTEDIYGRIFSLPLYPRMTERDVSDVVRALQRSLAGGRS
jgi:dTDP-4-amino-4,6-dideoxygalactose transaminase